MIGVAKPTLEKSLFITQDGYDGDELDHDPQASNFKFLAWEEIAKSFTPKLAITPRAYDR